MDRGIEIEITEEEKLLLARLGWTTNGALCPLKGCRDKIFDKEVEECAKLIQLAEEGKWIEDSNNSDK